MVSGRIFIETRVDLGGRCGAPSSSLYREPPERRQHEVGRFWQRLGEGRHDFDHDDEQGARVREEPCPVAREPSVMASDPADWLPHDAGLALW